MACLENPHGQRSLVDYSPWGPKETAEQLSIAHSCRLSGQELACQREFNP